MINRKRNWKPKAIVGNIFDYIESENIDGIQSAANGIGPMGAGIAGAIRRVGGSLIQTDAFRVCKKLKPEAGDAYSTISGSLQLNGVKRIIHACTMKKPGGITSLEIVKKAFESAVSLAIAEGIKRIGCTALGTGVGGLKSTEVARVMFPVAKEVSDKIEILFIDIDKDFIEEITKQ